MALADIAINLQSDWHDERGVALLILTLQFPKADASSQKKIYDLYLAHTARINARIVSRVPLNRVELIQNGRVIESSEVSGRESRMEKAVPVDGSCWFALRVTGAPDSAEVKKQLARWRKTLA